MKTEVLGQKWIFNILKVLSLFPVENGTSFLKALQIVFALSATIIGLVVIGYVAVGQDFKSTTGFVKLLESNKFLNFLKLLNPYSWF
jgi:hypothetical protein